MRLYFCWPLKAENLGTYMISETLSGEAWVTLTNLFKALKELQVRRLTPEEHGKEAGFTYSLHVYKHHMVTQT